MLPQENDWTLAIRVLTLLVTTVLMEGSRCPVLLGEFNVRWDTVVLQVIQALLSCGDWDLLQFSDSAPQLKRWGDTFLNVCVLVNGGTFERGSSQGNPS